MFVKVAAPGEPSGRELLSVLVVNQLDPLRRLDSSLGVPGEVPSQTSGRSAQSDAYIPAWSLESQSRQVTPATMLPPVPMTFVPTVTRKSIGRVGWTCVFIGLSAAILAVGLALT